VVAADCRGAASSGLLQLMPKRRTTCSFQMQLPVVTVGSGSSSSSGAVVATGSMEGTAMAVVTLQSGASEVQGEPLGFKIPAAAAAAAATADGSTPGGAATAAAQSVTVGRCAKLWSGITVSDALPLSNWAGSVCRCCCCCCCQWQQQCSVH